jgi:SecY interacting protein Syd
MNQDIELTLQRLTQRVLDKNQAQQTGLSIPEDLLETESPCINGDHWLPVSCKPVRDFNNVEEGIELELQSSIKAFYGVQYSADIELAWKGNSFTLLQVWSDEDFERLQENILGHLVTQRRLKLKPTVFIGVTDAELDVISICNLTGEVILERLGTSNRDVLAPDLVSFLDNVEV